MMTPALGATIAMAAGIAGAIFILGYFIGRDEGYSQGRRDGWMQYDSIVPDIRDECEQLKRGGKR